MNYNMVKETSYTRSKYLYKDKLTHMFKLTNGKHVSCICSLYAGTLNRISIQTGHKDIIIKIVSITIWIR